jgi:hypothetical protein
MDTAQIPKLNANLSQLSAKLCPSRGKMEGTFSGMGVSSNRRAHWD